jgi:hypothetical protein
MENIMYKFAYKFIAEHYQPNAQGVSVDKLSSGREINNGKVL